MYTAKRILCGVAAVALSICCLVGSGSTLSAAEYQWDFRGNLDSSFGGGILTYADASSEVFTSFHTTDGITVAHIGGQPATYMHVPAFTNQNEGYNLELTATGPNGGGEYVNQYTMVFDLYVPNDLNWTPLFNTNPENANDADMYLAYDGSIGIGNLGYTDINLIAPDTWYRVAFAADLGAGRVTYYLNGTPVFAFAGESRLDGRQSLYSNADLGHDVRLFNEGDSSDIYTHDLYVSSFYITDREFSASEIAALGGPTADGIVEVGLTGDYNGDGIVNAADYVVWRNSYGQTGAGLAADGNGNEEIDTGDYEIWKDHFGQSTDPGLALPATMVPEPGCLGLGPISLAIGVALRTRKVRR